MGQKKEVHSEDSLDKTLSNYSDYAVVILVGAFSLFCAYGILVVLNKWSVGQAELGQLGDFLGGFLNPIIGIFTVILILFSINIQRKELHDTNIALATQNAAIARQSFEQTFFAWLSNYHLLVSSFTYKKYGDPRTYSGRDALEAALNILSYQSLKAEIQAQVISKKTVRLLDEFKDIGKRDSDIILDLVRCHWHWFNASHGQYVEPMLRTLYRLIKWIDEQPDDVLDQSKKFHYVSIARAQMSRAETILLIFNGYSKYGDRFNLYVNRYALFDNLAGLDELTDFLINTSTAPFEESAFNSDLAREAELPAQIQL